MEIINDDELKNEILATLVNNYEHAEDSAQLSVDNNGEAVINAMREAFDEYIQQYGGRK